MTYLVQAIAGVVIAGSAIFIVLWRKFRKKVSKTLNIDENKNKTVEEDVVILDESQKDNSETETPAEEQQAETENKEDKKEEQ